VWSQTQTSLLAPSPVLLAASFCAACRAMSMQRGLGTLKYRKPYGIHFKLRAQCRVENAEQSEISLVLRVANKNDRVREGEVVTRTKRALPAAFPCSAIIRPCSVLSAGDDQVCLQAAEPEPMPLSGPTAIRGRPLWATWGRRAAGYRQYGKVRDARGGRARGTASLVCIYEICRWHWHLVVGSTAVMCCVSPSKTVNNVSSFNRSAPYSLFRVP